MRKFALALLMMIIPIPWLTGCGTIHFTGLAVIEEPDGVVVTNSTSGYTIVVKKLGGTSTGMTTRVVASPMIERGGMWVADTKNLSYRTPYGSYDNRYDKVLIWCDVYKNGEYVGESRFYYYPVSVASQSVYRDLWMVHDSDIRFAAPNNNCR